MTTVVQKVQARKAVIANVIKSCSHQDFFTTFSSWSKENTRRLLILDSSFNPPTKAHEQLLIKAMENKPQDYYDASLLLFSINNADKQLTGASVLQRAQMMEIMARSFEKNIAVGLTPHGKFIDKASAIASWFQHPVELEFILGYDTITRFFDPKYYNVPLKEALTPFFSTCRLVCADRGQDECQFWQGLRKDYSQMINRIQLDADMESISSTQARSCIKEQKNEQLEKILNSNIIQFIQQEDSLYL